jgi:site-specific recombinase XerD/ribosomal protein L40E
MSIYREESKIKSNLRRIMDSDLSENNKIWIKKFYDEICVRDFSRLTVAGYTDRISTWVKYIAKDLDKLTKDDTKEMVRRLEENGYAKSTKSMLKGTLKKILQFVHEYEWDSREYPECVSWLKTKTEFSEPREVLTKEEVLKMIEGAYNIRDKAFISILYESGCRVSEILTLKIKHVEFDNYGAIIRVEGKTGVRRVRLVSSVVYLSQWLNAHPSRDNADAPLWVSMGNRNHENKLSYLSFYLILRRIAKKVGVEKKINPHSFRHARATHLASKLTEAQMKEYFGWVQGSRMASVYVHMSGRDVDNTILQMHGIIPQEEKKEEISIRTCPLCNERNATTNDYCRRCGSSLMQENEFLKFLSQPDVLDVLSKKLAEQMKTKH